MPQIKSNPLKLTEILLTHFIRVRSCHIIPFCPTHFYSKIVKFLRGHRLRRVLERREPYRLHHTAVGYTPDGSELTQAKPAKTEPYL